MIPLLERVHGASEHTGEADAAALDAAAGSSAPPPARAAAPETSGELKRLRRDLQRVIKNEEYEEAARIRDRIQQIEKQLHEGGAADG